MGTDETVELMRCAAVIPSRSVRRIRRALAEGRDIEPYLADIESGVAQVMALADAHEESRRCPVCKQKVPSVGVLGMEESDD